MEDEMRIDGHKLDYHIDKVASWQRGETTPVYMEISPTARCNHKCSFCTLDFTNHTDITIPTQKLKQIGTELAAADVRGVMFAGEGEPTLHPKLAPVIAHYSHMGIHTALTTNGFGLSPEFAIEGGDRLAWVKVSINGGDEKAYSLIHGKGASLQKCFYNIGEFRRGCGGSVPTLGSQAVALTQNFDSLPELCQRSIDAGLDYVVIKPFSPNAYSPKAIKEMCKMDWDWLEMRCKKICEGKIKLVMRHHAWGSLQDLQVYARCLSVPYFWAYVRSNMDLVACSNHMQDDRFVLGNLDTSSFKELWYSHSTTKREELKTIMRSFDVSQCRKACRMNAVNEWLWRISSPHPHRSFI